MFAALSRRGLKADICQTATVLQVKGAEKVLYGLDDVAGQSTIVVVEGGCPAVTGSEAPLCTL